MNDALSIAQALIRCPSVTPADAGALGVLESLLKSHGFETHRVIFSEAGTPDVDNLYARIGTGAPHLTFAGHTDVVPPGDESAWSHGAFSGEVKDGYLYGRGAVDMKGGIACSVAAVLQYLAEHGGKPQKNGKGSISFLITGDEEAASINGTVKLLKWAADRGEKFDHCVLGEPSNQQEMGDCIKIGRRGSQSGTLYVDGVQGHVAYPHTQASLRELVETRLARATGNRIKARIVWEPSNSNVFVTKPGAFTDLAVSAIEEITGRKPELSTTGGTSDARFIASYCPVIEFGLLGQTMHQIDERASVKDIEVLTRIYRGILDRYFG
jgi:acetylornithine deacetylase/succinyl-diaminopimelate desuccinylase-like protein